MTLPSQDPANPAVPQGSPIETDGPRLPLYTPEFAADPHSAYRALRERYGSLAPVDLAPDVPATLVLGYRTAVHILNDPEHFPADPRAWQKSAPAGSPIMAQMAWRPNAMHTAGSDHARYRQANTAAIDAVDQHGLHTRLEQLAVPLINQFCEAGQAELVSQYAFPLAAAALNEMLGCPDDLGKQITQGMAMTFQGGDVQQGNAVLDSALSQLVALKRKQPRDDVVSRLVRHPLGLDDEEMVHQLIALYSAGIEPMQNLVVNTLLLMVTDQRFAGNLLGGSMSTRDAIDEVLFNDPPIANFCVTYPRQPTLIDEVWLPANQPVVISMSAANTDPAVGTRENADNRSHLAFSVGPHACPARSVAYLIAQDAIDQLLDALPDLDLAVPLAELTWRPNPFHRSLASLPVTFPPSPPLRF